MKTKMFDMRGDYTITVKRHGKITQEENFHNLVTAGFVSRLIGIDINYFRYCQLGSGSTAPSTSDTALASMLWSVEYSTYAIDSTSADGLSRTWKYTYIFPANSSYVGTIREVGLSAASSGSINTHALVVDAEGQPISIDKTYLDEVTITAKITVTRPSWQSGQTWSFMSGPLSRSYLSGILQSSITGSRNRHVLLSAGWCPEYLPVKNCQYTSLPTNFTYSNGTIRCSAEFSGDAMTYPYGSDSGEKFKDYVNSLLLGCSSANPTYNDPSRYRTPPYRLLLPNADVFPITTLEGLTLGTGDGSTVDFTPDIPVWLENTEIVYKNDSPLIRGVDYFVDNLGNIGKYLSVMLGNFVAEIDAEVVEGVQANIWGTDECCASYSYGIDIINSPVVYTDSPIILKYGTAYAFSDKFNYFVLGTWTASESIPAGAALVFYYSMDDGSTWTEFGRISHSSAGTAFTDTAEHTIVTPIAGITHVKIALEDTDTTAYVRMSARNGRFGYVGSYAIRFASAPAAGDILTIDMNIDRPWKSNDNLIQWNPILSFGV